ncbi:MAG: radical SAM family heme chaperone HemW [Verrucomicrobia bacterium]|nr:radical SAM family heme chaperone HemW [Verrucomicrobiota bacterium]MCG2681386.1 radical SAM family heme chaperone HemW [Kiritimatiellia bacterium]MBU4248159.1 radical SAM family heme chaperone HemW [Verrucomicrobiota bacterium]MBU4291802.1 radical SAM family heme chaperone HemW [Verrucomicrobiota bacterium]MBU4427816.1 radical SAM family heme chaperone HemW [Verrucomicrobiota bacterium]
MKFIKTDIPRVTGLYVHIPFCDGKCDYCAFYSVPYDAVLADRLLAALEKELVLSVKEIGVAPAAATIYIGGGTPSILSSAQLERLCDVLKSFVSVSAPVEWTVEMNPGSVTAEKLAVLVRAGVNRISLGAQSFHDGVLKLLGRRHSVADIYRSVERIRLAGVTNIGLDLIAGVPGFGEDVWQDTLEQAIALAPRHVSVYALTDEEGTRLNQAIGRGDTELLSDEAQLAALDAAETVLTAAGYGRYEISNYAQPGFECRHHCECWRGGEYLGIGPAAASHAGMERWTNQPDLAGYLEALEQDRPPPRDRDPLTPALKTMEQIVFGMRMAEGISAETAASCEAVLGRLQAEGLVDLRNRCWMLTPRGRHLADYVAVELLGAVDQQ